MGSEMCIRDRYRVDPIRFVGQWDTVLKGRENLVTDQQKRTVSVVGLWDTLLKEMIPY